MTSRDMTLVQSFVDPEVSERYIPARTLRNSVRQIEMFLENRFIGAIRYVDMNKTSRMIKILR